MSILTHLQNGGSLTPKDALNLFGSFRLAAHIESLRRDGHNIFTHMVSENGKKYAKYTYTRKE
jgi:Helix-turn-helix domain